MGLFDLSSKRILVAGARGLIGAAICEGLKEHGAQVVEADIRDNDDCCEYLNLSDGGKSLWKILEGESVHGFVNVTYPRDFATHTTGWLLAMRIVAEHMYQHDIHGSIVNFSSIYGLVGVDHTRYDYTDGMEPPSAEYAMIKGGIIAASRMMATEFALHDIRVNTIAPGGVEHNQHKTFRLNYESDTPMNRMADANDMVGTVIYLLADAESVRHGAMLGCRWGIRFMVKRNLRDIVWDIADTSRAKEWIGDQLYYIVAERLMYELRTALGMPKDGKEKVGDTDGS